MAQGPRSLSEIEEMLPARLKKDPQSLARIRSAWTFAEQAHAGQQRRSGDPHTEHLYHTAKKLSELDMGSETIAAGILHDTIEDTETTQEDLERIFGSTIAFLVAGVTKLKMEKSTRQSNAIESLRRLFRTAAEDPRILIIKLSDRLHNMHTLGYLPPRARKRIAAETIEIYAHVADRLGMNLIKRELEDLAFLHYLPEEYRESECRFAARLAERAPAVEKAEAELAAHLAAVRKGPVRVQRHQKGAYSFFLKLERKGGDTAAINDIVTLEVIVPTVSDCYEALGQVHALWRPVPAKLKDYISFPKPNGYQCLRTTVDAGVLGIIEVQIYSEGMYERAQQGYAVELAERERSQGARPSLGKLIGDIWTLASRRTNPEEA